VFTWNVEPIEKYSGTGMLGGVALSADLLD